MTIFKAGPLVQAASGSIAATTFVNAKGTPVIRRKALRTNRATQAQTNHRAILAQLGQLWAALSDPQRQAWGIAAALRPFRNALGLPFTLNGWQLFAKLNTLTISSDLPRYADPPIMIQSKPPKTTTIEFDTSPNYHVSWTTYLPESVDRVIVYGSRPVTSRPKKQFYNWRLITGGIGTFFTIDVTDEWISILGQMAEGETFALELILWLSTKLPAQRFRVVSTVTAP